MRYLLIIIAFLAISGCDSLEPRVKPIHSIGEIACTKFGDSLLIIDTLDNYHGKSPRGGYFDGTYSVKNRNQELKEVEEIELK